MSLVDTHVPQGARVQLMQALPGIERYNTTQRFDLPAGTLFTVSRAYSESILVRTVDTHLVQANRYWNDSSQEHRHISFSISRFLLQFEDPNYVPPPPPPPPRQFGKKPENTEEMTYISITDPGIQWLWDDLGKYADEQGYCQQYDALCARIGLPGRPRDFEVRKTVNGIDVRATIKARSQREANEKFALAMASSTVGEDQKGETDDDD